MELSHDLFVCTYMRNSLIISAVVVFLFACSRDEDKTPVNVEDFSVELLQQIQNDKPYRKHLDSLRFASIENLQKQLATDKKKKAFWINLYNSFVQIKIKENPTSYQNTAAFFEDPTFMLAGTNISLKDIESMVLLEDPSAGNIEKLALLKLTKEDPRILFALNCGSVSCPPIAYYDSEKIDLQLELAESIFIKSDCSYDPFSDELRVPELLKQLTEEDSIDLQINRLLKKHRIIPIQANPEIIFTPYNWSPQLPEFR